MPDFAASSSADADAAVLDAGKALQDAVAVLLAGAQDHGAVRPDITAADLHAITTGALVMERRLGPDSQGRGLAVVTDGLRAFP